MKVYGGTGFTSTGRVLLTLFEKAIAESDIEIINIDFTKEEQKSPEHVKRQPFAQIPVLEDGDITLYESRAIARTIAHKYANQGTALYGSTPKDAALTEQWLEVESQNFHPPISEIVHSALISPFYGQPVDDAALAAAITKLGSVLDVYEIRLSESKYLAGDFFSLADLSHIPFSYYMIKGAKMGATFDARPHVKAWIDDIFSRPHTQKWFDLASSQLRILTKCS